MAKLDVTDEQIAELEVEAACAGDLEQVHLCQVALRQNRGPGLSDLDRAIARRKCVKAILAARANAGT